MVNHSHVEEITPKDISPKNLIPTYSQYTAYSLKENKKIEIEISVDIADNLD